MQTFNRREFVAVGLGAATAKAIAPPLKTVPLEAAAPEELLSLSLGEVSKRIRARQVTSVELTQALIDRIKIYNPKINAYITVMHDQALAQAAQMDAEIRANKFRS